MQKTKICVPMCLTLSKKSKAYFLLNQLKKPIINSKLVVISYSIVISLAKIAIY